MTTPKKVCLVTLARRCRLYHLNSALSQQPDCCRGCAAQCHTDAFGNLDQEDQIPCVIGESQSTNLKWEPVLMYSILAPLVNLGEVQDTAKTL